MSSHLLAARAKKAIRRGYAKSWYYLYKAQYLIAAWKARRAGLGLGVLLLLLLALSVYLSPAIQTALEANYASEKGIEALPARADPDKPIAATWHRDRGRA